MIWMLKARDILPVILMGSVVMFFGLQRIWLSDMLSLASSIQDDSFYYILSGWFVSRVGFFSFDGVTTTYGFQPLYALWVGLLGIISTDLGQLLRFALTSNLVFHVITGGVIFYLARTLSSSFFTPILQQVSGLVAATFWYLNLPLYLSQLTAKENALATLILTLVLLLSLRVKSSHVPSKRLAVVFGFFSGLLLITRIHPSSFFILVACWGIIYWMRLSSNNSEAHFYRWSVLSAVMPVLAWGMYAESAFHQVMPTSGLVKLGDHSIIPTFLKCFNSSSLWQESLVYLFNAIDFSVGLGSKFHLPQFDASLLEPHVFSLTLRERFLRLSVLVLVSWGLGAGLICLKVRALWLLIILGMASLLGHWVTFVLLSQRGEIYYYIWYIYDMPVFMSLISSLSLVCFIQMIYRCQKEGSEGASKPILAFLSDAAKSPYWSWSLTVAYTIFIVFVGLGVERYRPFESFIPNSTDWQNVMIQAGIRVKDDPHLDPRVKIVAWSSGALGFLMPGRVINLDGLANDEVLKARQLGKTEVDIILSLGKAYFVDLLPNFLGDTRLQSRLIDKINFPVMGDYYIYEFSRRAQ